MTARAQEPSFAVRAPDRWSVTPAGSDQPVPVTLDELIDVLERSQWAPSPSPARQPRAPVAVSDQDPIEPVWMLVGAITARGWLLEGPDHGQLLLDTDDLRLLDALTTVTTAADLAAATGVVDAGVRIGRLMAGGHVRAHTPSEQHASTGSDAVGGRWVPTRPVVDPGGDEGRVPVYSVWHPEIGPLLSLGMLTAAARAHDGGALNEVFEIRRPESAESFLADLAGRRGPAVLLCSDYVWSLEANLEAARRAIRCNPDLLVVHGGPSSPKYAGDAERFLHEHADVAHVLTRGEGEHLIGVLLAALADTLPDVDPARLGAIAGLTFRDPASGAIVRTDEPERIADLDALPSPYLTGEFDHLPGSAWTTCLSVETNRGCPYGCTFCDWGSATLSRIRMFDPGRVEAEIRWAAERGVQAVNIPDANFGIMSRDVETAQRVAAVKREFGAPKYLVFYPAKNTTKHLARIMDILGDAGISSAASLSLQTIDPDTLAALDRSNISTDHFVALAAEYRRRHHPLQGDLLVGVPGQTYETYKRDLQFMFDHEILARSWPVQILPNAPMNDPAYRRRHAIEVEDDLVVATSTFSRSDRAHMLRLRKFELIADRYGVLRHVLRWLQWDHGIPALDVVDHLVETIDGAAERLPHLSWVLGYFDLFPTAPVSWRAVNDDVRSLVTGDLGIPASAALEVVLTVQESVMPAPGRVFPASYPLDHDYVAYYQDATESLYGDGRAGSPPRPLGEYGPSVLVVEGDPLGLCDQGMLLAGDSRDERSQGQFQIGATVANELASPLLRFLPHVEASGMAPPAHRVPVAAPPPDRGAEEVDLDDRRLIQVSVGPPSIARRA